MDGAQERQMGEDEQPSAASPIPRRRFLRWLLGFSVVSTMAMVAAPVVTFLVPPKSSASGSGGKVLAGTVADIPVGSGKVVAMGSEPTIVVNTAQGVFAYSAICTHLGCIVMFDDMNGTIVCPCHDGRFSPENGTVVSGPPPAALASVAVVLEDDEIYVVGG
jgi:cytochrome b6-f complex iron-sulfur subunit